MDDLTDIKLDSGFKEFFRYCKSQDIPVIIVSRYGEGVILRAHSSNADMSYAAPPQRYGTPNPRRPLQSSRRRCE